MKWISGSLTDKRKLWNNILKAYECKIFFSFIYMFGSAFTDIDKNDKSMVFWIDP